MEVRARVSPYLLSCSLPGVERAGFLFLLGTFPSSDLLHSSWENRMAAWGMFSGRLTEDHVTLSLRRVWLRWASGLPGFTMVGGYESWSEGAGINLDCQEPWLASFFFSEDTECFCPWMCFTAKHSGAQGTLSTPLSEDKNKTVLHQRKLLWLKKKPANSWGLVLGKSHCVLKWNQVGVDIQGVCETQTSHPALRWAGTVNHWRDAAWRFCLWW